MKENSIVSDQAEKQKLKETSPDARVEHKAARAGSDQAQAEMPEHQRQVQEKKSQFEQAGLSSSPRTHVSETFGRLQMEDQGQVLVKGDQPGSEGPFRHTNPIDRTAATQEKIAQLQRLSKENEPLVREFADSIDAKYGTQSKVSFKDPADIAEKASRPSIKTDRPWFDVEHVRDALRFKTVLQDLTDLPRLIEDLKKSGFEIIKCDAEKLLKPKGRGWRMAAFDLKTPNGQIIEYQILPPEMERAGALEHQVYKQWRKVDINKLSKEERKAIRRADTAAKDMYEKAWQDYLNRTGQTTDSIRQVLHKIFQNLEE